jgi:hypothetical protein
MIPPWPPTSARQATSSPSGHAISAIIAAYRDQHQVQDSDSLQILGPWAGPGRAGDAAYWPAARAVLDARREAGLEPPAPTADEPAARASRQVAADIYAALPQPEREAIAAQIAAALGPFWYGDPERPSPQAAAQPAYDQHLAGALTQRGHLTTATIEQQPAAEPGTIASPVEADRVRARQAAPEAARSERAPLLQPPPPEPPGHEPIVLP